VLGVFGADSVLGVLVLSLVPVVEPPAVAPSPALGPDSRLGEVPLVELDERESFR